MAKDKKENLIAWLNDAYAMEQSLIQNLEEKSKDADKENKSEIQKRIDQHIEETKEQAEMLKTCIENLGGSTSKFKELMGKTSGLFRGSAKSMYDDVLVKNALEAYAAEHFEIASYTSLIAAAEEIGEEETASVCRKILEQEKNMASWLEKQIPNITVEYLNS